MKLTLERDALLRALKAADAVVERRNTVPILSMVRLVATARPKQLTLTTTNLDQEATLTLALTKDGAGTVDAAGEICVDSSRLTAIVGKLPGGSQLTLTVTGEHRLIVASPGCEFDLPTLPPADFPVMDRTDCAQLSIVAEDLSRLLARVAHGISKEETRYYLNGVFLTAHNGALRTVATDGHRLALCDGPDLDDLDPTGELPLSDAAGIIIPTRAVGLLRKALDATDPDRPVTLSLSESRIGLETDGLTLISKLIDGSFPDYKRVVPRQFGTMLTLPASTLAQAVERVAVLSTEKSRTVSFDVRLDGLTVSTDNPELGSAEERLGVPVEGDPVRIGFNARYLLDALSALGADADIRVDLGASAAPARLMIPDQAGHLDVLMPLRV